MNNLKCLKHINLRIQDNAYYAGINHTKFLLWCLINRQNMSIILLLMNLVHFQPYYAAIL